MIRRPPRSTRTDILFPYTTLFRSEVVMTGFALRSHHVDHEAAHTLVMLFDRCACAHGRHAYIDDHRAGKHELANLPAIDFAMLAHCARPERRRIAIEHPATAENLFAFHDSLDRGVPDFRLTDRTGVDIGLVGEVHQKN